MSYIRCPQKTKPMRVKSRVTLNGKVVIRASVYATVSIRDCGLVRGNATLIGNGDDKTKFIARTMPTKALPDGVTVLSNRELRVRDRSWTYVRFSKETLFANKIATLHFREEQELNTLRLAIECGLATKQMFAAKQQEFSRRWKTRRKNWRRRGLM